MRTLLHDAAADHLLDHLSSDGNGSQWLFYASPDEWVTS
jgi:hypothetical protein